MPVDATYEINGWPNETVTFNYQLVVESCPSCGITYAIPDEVDSRLTRFNKADYPNKYAFTYCPNGHAWHRTGSDSPLAKERVARQRAEEALAATQDLLNEKAAAVRHERARADGYKGVVAKTRKRLAAGVCPHCNRSGFAGDRLIRHIATKHPSESVSA